MKFAKVKTAIITGLKINIADLEITILSGFPVFEISGISNNKGQQCFSRVRAALKNNGFQIPRGRIICHLTKEINNGDVRTIDLALALALLIADQQINNFQNITWFIVGQLGLSGSIQKTCGIFAMSRELELEKYYWIIPQTNQNELQNTVLERKYVAKDISMAVEIIEGKNLSLHQPQLEKTPNPNYISEPIFEILGQPLAKRAVLIALAGWHPLLLIGSPGSGKTTIAEQTPYFMPALNEKELDEVRKIYSLNGLWNQETNLGIIRPFKAPHHTVTQMALIGGGPNLTPGIITQAHNGILFLDELSEFKLHILELLKKPLSEKQINLARKNEQQLYPANFLLIAATNPCPCGYLFEKDNRCKCSLADLKRFKKKIQGSLLDRFQLVVVMNDLPQTELIKTAQTKIIEQTEIEKIQNQIRQAQVMQDERCISNKISPERNALIKANRLAKFFQIVEQDLKSFNKLISGNSFSPRTYLAILRIARTIADLEESFRVKQEHLHEALLLRQRLNLY